MVDRNKGIGGTDIGAIIGVNPWRNAMDVYLEKVGITEPPEENEAMYWGKALESALMKRYIRDTPQRFNSPFDLIRPPEALLPISHKHYPWYLASPDAIWNPEFKEIKKSGQTFLKAEAGVDFKTTARRQDYGEFGTDEVPEYVATQCHWYLGITGARWWEVAVLFMGYRREFGIFRLKRNDEIITNLIEAGQDFWGNHVLPQIPPPLDASEASKTLLNYLYPRDQGEMLDITGQQAESWLQVLKAHEQIRDDAVRNLTLTQNRLKDIIGDAAGVQTSLGKVTWKKSKDRESVDYKAIFDELIRDSVIGKETSEVLIYKHTQLRPGSRVFRTTWKGEDK